MLKERKLIYLFNCFGLDVNIQQNCEMKRMHLREILFRKNAGKPRILQESTGNHGKKSEKFPAGRLLPQNHRNYLEPAVSGPDCSTWEDSKQKKIYLMKKRGQRIIEMKILYLLYH